MKKKILALAMAILSMFVLVACGSSSKEKLNFFFWGGTVNTEVLTKFENETGIKVEFSEFDENEKMYTLVKNSPELYDIVVPSEYMVEKMMAEGMLEELDHSKIPNIKEIDPVFLNREFDPGNKYSLPMFYGTVGILYNKTKVDPADMDQWNAIYNEKYKGEIWMLSSSRDTLAPAYWHLGYSANSKDPKHLAEAKELAMKQKALVKGYLQDEIKQHMINGNGAIAVVYSAEAFDAIQENPDLAYYIPEKSNMWIDNYAVIKGSKNYENAMKFLDFMNKPENAAMSGAIQATPVTGAKEIEPTKEMAQNPVLYPAVESLKNLEVYTDLGDFVDEFEQAWEDVTNH